MDNLDIPDPLMPLACNHFICRSCLKIYVIQEYRTSREDANFACIAWNYKIELNNNTVEDFIKQIISPTVFHQEFGSNTDSKKKVEENEEGDRDKTSC